MAIKCDEYNQVCVIAVEGDFSNDACGALRRSAEERIEQRHIVDFVIDMGKAPFVDSEGLETLLWLKQKCEGLAGQVKLVKLDENCSRILEITRLEHRFH